LSRAVLRSAAITLLVALGSSLITLSLQRGLGRTRAGVFPPAFLFSSLSLLLGSVSLQRSLYWVRREKQRLFRRWLIIGLLCGTMFFGVQTYALQSLFPPDRSAAEASLGITVFLSALATLHAMHFVVAVLFLAFVTAQSSLDRYDHEYYWGVTVCAWFWHGLGIAWIAILCVFAIAW